VPEVEIKCNSLKYHTTVCFYSLWALEWRLKIIWQLCVRSMKRLAT